MNPEAIEQLWKDFGGHTDLTNAEEFGAMMQNPDGRKQFYADFAKHMDLKDFGEFEQMVGQPTLDPEDRGTR